MLGTRSPVYSPCGFLPRLACVRHAASVRSEPGSNSPIGYYRSLILLCWYCLSTRPARLRDKTESLKVMRCFRIHFLNFCSLVFKDPNCSRLRASDDSAATGWLLRLALQPGAVRGLAASCEGGGFYSSAFCPSTSFFDFSSADSPRFAAAVSKEAACTSLLPPRQPLSSVRQPCLLPTALLPRRGLLPLRGRRLLPLLLPPRQAPCSTFLSAFPSPGKPLSVRGARCVLPGLVRVNDLSAQCVRKRGFASGGGDSLESTVRAWSGRARSRVGAGCRGATGNCRELLQRGERGGTRRCFGWCGDRGATGNCRELLQRGGTRRGWDES